MQWIHPRRKSETTLKCKGVEVTAANEQQLIRDRENYSHAWLSINDMGVEVLVRTPSMAHTLTLAKRIQGQLL